MLLKRDQGMSLKSKPRVALLIEEPNVVGGIQSAASRHIKLLSDAFEIIPVCFDKSRFEKDWYGRTEPLKNFAGGRGYQIIVSNLKSDTRISESSSLENIRFDIRYRSMADHLIEIIRKEKIDLIHSFGQFHQRGVIAAFASAKTGVPYILSFRGVDLETRIFDSNLQQIHASLLGAKAAVCVSEDSARLLNQFFKPTCPVHVVRNHLDPSMFADGVGQLPLLQETKLPVIGCFGKFRRVMGLDFLLKAFEKINEKRPAILFLAGDFQKRESEFYNGLIESTRFNHNILRASYFPHAQILNYMRLCDVMVYPSISDASPNKVLEAMYAKVPVVSTEAGGIPELVTNEKEALLVPARSIETLAEAIERILDDENLVQRLTDNAFQRVTTEFRSENEKPLWMKVYLGALTAEKNLNLVDRLFERSP
jgi:glycosyltransferase involved in cell wall biosynthesis